MMRRLNIYRSLAASAAGLVTAAAMLGGCSTTETPEPTVTGDATTLDELYQVALDAGQTTITIYGPAEAQLAPVYEKFSERFPGIEVKGEFLFGGELEARLQQEVATGQHVGDLVHLDDAVRYTDIMQSFEIVGVDDMPDDVPLLDGKLYVTSRSLYGFAYNASKLSTDDVPTTWADVISPDFEAVIGMSNPTSLAATSMVLYTAYTNDAIDEDWLASLAGRQPSIYQSSSQMVAALASGEIDFTPVAYYGFIVTQVGQGADVGFVVPEDGVVLADNPYGLLEGAPSPIAAQLLVSWLLSDEGQAAIVENVAEYGTMPSAPSPEGLPAVDELDIFPSIDVPERIPFKEEGVEFLKQWF